MKRRILAILFILKTVFAFSGGSACHISIANLTGEDLYLLVKYEYFSHEPISGFAKEHNGEKVLLSGSLNPDDEGTFMINILSIHGEYDRQELMEIVYNDIITINIYDKNGELLLSFYDILEKGICSFNKLHSFGPPVLDWEGYYYINIYKSDITSNNDKTTHYTTERLNLRAYDNSNEKIITVLSKGQEVEAIEVGADEPEDYFTTLHRWIKVRTRDNLEGFVSAKYLAPKN